MNRLLISLGFMFLVGPAMAGTVYRCVGTDGVPNYSSKRVGNAVCKAIARSSEQARISAYSPSRAAAPAAVTTTQASTPAAQTAPSAKEVVFRSAPAGVAPLQANARAGATRRITGSLRNRRSLQARWRGGS